MVEVGDVDVVRREDCVIGALHKLNGSGVILDQEACRKYVSLS